MRHSVQRASASQSSSRQLLAAHSPVTSRDVGTFFAFPLNRPSVTNAGHSAPRTISFANVARPAAGSKLVARVVSAAGEHFFALARLLRPGFAECRRKNDRFFSLLAHGRTVP